MSATRLLNEGYSLDTHFFLFWPDAGKVREAGFPAVAHVPCVFDGVWIYQDIPSKYLRARATAQLGWDSKSTTVRRRRYPTPLSLRAYGEALVNFLEWCAAKKRPWESVDYIDDVVYGYQSDMSEGRWSVRKEPLKPRTINARVDEACNFLLWAVGKNYRKEFKVPRVPIAVSMPSGTSTHGPRRKQVLARIGSVRADPIMLRIPTDMEVECWQKTVRIESGFTKALMCQLVMSTAIRREEAAQWQIDTLPLSERDWRINGDVVMVGISDGAKGPKRSNDSGRNIGPLRYITFPLKLAYDLHHYREKIRPRLLATYVRSADSTEEKRRRMNNATTRLFLSDVTGEPVSGHRLAVSRVKRNRGLMNGS